MVDCLKVGRMVDGHLVPWSNSKEHRQNFIGRPENLPKHCVEDLSWVKYSQAGCLFYFFSVDPLTFFQNGCFCTPKSFYTYIIHIQVNKYKFSPKHSGVCLKGACQICGFCRFLPGSLTRSIAMPSQNPTVTSRAASSG